MAIIGSSSVRSIWIVVRSSLALSASCKGGKEVDILLKTETLSTTDTCITEVLTLLSRYTHFIGLLGFQRSLAHPLL